MASKTPGDNGEKAGSNGKSRKGDPAIKPFKPAREEGLLETVKTIVYAVLIALVVRTFAYEPFNIPSGSMIPTLLVGDYLFVSKLSYGYSRYSFPWGLAPIEGRVFENEPERGDVAVFRLPSDTSIDYIKRIVGLPGDRIQMRAGVLHINGEPVQRQRIDDYTIGVGSVRQQTVRRYVETLPTGRSYEVIEVDGDIGMLDNTPEYLVPEGHYFAMGDNRDRSQDSRVLGQVGYIPAENLIGRAEILFFSIDETASWWKVWTWPMAIRYGRLFDAIE